MIRAALSLAAATCVRLPACVSFALTGALCLSAAAQEAGGSDVPAASANVYEPGFFVRFAPQTAADMLGAIPGFTISGSGGERGLGQASENVLINGRRVSGKSNDAWTALSRIPADAVVRIEIVDGASLDIPGLSGQVANVIARLESFSGSWTWYPEITENASPSLLRGDLTASGASGDGWTWSASLNAVGFGGGARGFGRVTSGAGEPLDLRREKAGSRGDGPTLSGSLGHEAPDGSALNINATLSSLNVVQTERSPRAPAGLAPFTRLSFVGQDTRSLELGADYEFDLGPGRLKLIGLQSLSEEASGVTVEAVAGAQVLAGQRFESGSTASESIMRAEYGLGAFGGDVQLAGEGAFNVLDLSSALGARGADGSYAVLPLEDGVARVEEARAEASLSFSRQLAEGVSLQSSLGVEYSELSQTGAGGLSRQFVRPKGFVALAFQPEPDLDVSLKATRKVGQLDFGDFLYSVDLRNENSTLGNVELVPEQAWIASAEINRRLGPWGAITFALDYTRIEDVVDQIPLGVSGSAVGNIDSATAYTVSTSGTFNLDPLGLKGVQVALSWSYSDSEVDDPLTGRAREVSFSQKQAGNLLVRWDVPETNWTISAGLEEAQTYPGYRLDEIARSWSAPTIDFFLIENKDVFGLKVRLEVINLGGMAQYGRRDVFEDGRRTRPLAFTEERQFEIGRMMRLNIAGTF